MQLPSDLEGRDFLRVQDWSRDELFTVLDLADRLKADRAAGVAHELLPGRTLGLLFEKPSTRTRVSFQVGMAQLGGMSLYLGQGELHLGRSETIRDTALVLSRYLDAIVVRTFAQADVEELAAFADVPVINGLTDAFHPCQALADLQTIRERFGTLEGIRLAYIGDGNNVLHSLLVACGAVGISAVAATPAGHEPDGDVLELARAAAAQAGSTIELTNDPREAARAADVLYTDVWTSMGQEADHDRRLRDFRGFTVDSALLAHAEERAIVLHCLPAHQGEEIAEDVLHGPRSAAWDQAENRLHAQKALLALVVP